MHLEALLRRQHGLISRAQAIGVGLSEDQIDRRLRSGRWVSIHPGVYLPADRELVPEARILAVGLWAGDRATVGGLAAAWWHRLWSDPPSIVEVTVPRESGVRPRPGIRVRHRHLAAEDRVWTRGMWVTGVPLTVLEAAVALGDRGSELMDRALQQRVPFAALYRARCRGAGRRGSAQASQLLVAAADRAASAAERRAVALLREAQLTGWHRHYRTGGYEVDLAFPDHRLAVEVDGWAWHHDPERFRKDRQRQNALVLGGWTVLRFTWHDLTRRPAEVITEVRAALVDPESVAITRAQHG